MADEAADIVIVGPGDGTADHANVANDAAVGSEKSDAGASVRIVDGQVGNGVAKALEHPGEGVCARAGQGACKGGSGSVQVRRQRVQAGAARMVDPRDVASPGVRPGRAGFGQFVEQGVGLAVDAQRPAMVDGAEVDRGALGEGQVGRRRVVVGQTDRAGAGHCDGHVERQNPAGAAD